MWFRSARKGSWRWLFGVGYNDVAYAALRTGVVQLYLRGNGPYEDQTMELGPSFLTYHSYQSAGIGFEKSTAKTSWGAHRSLNKVKSIRQFKHGVFRIIYRPIWHVCRSRISRPI